MLPVRYLCQHYPVDGVILWEPTSRYPYQVHYPARAKQMLELPEELVWLNQDFDMEMGKEYWVLGQAGKLLVNGQEYELSGDGWTPITWKESIKVTPGNTVTESQLSWALGELRKTLMLRLLYIADFREIRVVPPEQFPPGYGGSMTFWQAERVLVIKDILSVGQATLIPASMAHEAFHLWQVEHGYPTNELAAYTVSQVFQFLRGDDLDVFKVYPGAMGLMGSV